MRVSCAQAKYILCVCSTCACVWVFWAVCVYLVCCVFAKACAYVYCFVCSLLCYWVVCAYCCVFAGLRACSQLRACVLYVCYVVVGVSHMGRGGAGAAATIATTHKPKSQRLAQTEGRSALIVIVSRRLGLGRPAAARGPDGELPGLGRCSRGHRGPQWRVGRTRLMGRERGTATPATGSAPCGRQEGTFSGW